MKKSNKLATTASTKTRGYGCTHLFDSVGGIKKLEVFLGRRPDTAGNERDVLARIAAHDTQAATGQTYVRAYLQGEQGLQKVRKQCS